MICQIKLQVNHQSSLSWVQLLRLHSYIHIYIYIIIYIYMYVFSSFVCVSFKRHYNIPNIILHYAAIKDPPTVIEVTDSSVTLEFLPSNATSSRYYVLYRPQSALDGTAYAYGAYINDDGRQAPMKYRVIQERISANTEYSFKIAPSIRVGATYHHTSESPVICVKTREQGKNQVLETLIVI